jgi:hypothetical protein
MKSGARLSPCRKYRYRLWRVWDDTRPPIVYILLNPSVADETEDDPTIVRCVRRAEMLGAGGIIVMNLFAWITPYRQELHRVPDPVGPDADAEILDACRGAGHVVCGWGNEGAHLGRGGQMLTLLRAHGVRPAALAVNTDGSPRHPLYVGYETPLIQLS